MKRLILLALVSLGIARSDGEWFCGEWRETGERVCSVARYHSGVFRVIELGRGFATVEDVIQ